MNILYAVVLMSLFGGEGPIPSQPGTTWVTESMEKGETVRVKWEVVKLPGDFTATLIGESIEEPKSMMPGSTEVTDDTPGLVGIKADGKLVYLLRTLPGEQRIYRDSYHGLGGGIEPFPCRAGPPQDNSSRGLVVYSPWSHVLWFRHILGQDQGDA